MGSNKEQSRNKWYRNKKCSKTDYRSGSWFFDIINTINKPLARLIKHKGEITKINKITERGKVTTNTTEI